MKFTLEWCETCKVFFVKCPKCGNNCCNGGYGPSLFDDVPKKEVGTCDICPLSYQYQELYNALVGDAYLHHD